MNDPRNLSSYRPIRLKYQKESEKDFWIIVSFYKLVNAMHNWKACPKRILSNRTRCICESGWLGWGWMGDGVKCVRPHPSWLAWRGEYYEGKCDCARSSPASPICLHINYQLGPPLWKNMTEYKVSLGHPWKPLPPAERGKCEVKCDCQCERRISSVITGVEPTFPKPWSRGEFDHAWSDTEISIYILVKSVWQKLLLDKMTLPAPKVRPAYQDW